MTLAAPSGPIRVGVVGLGLIGQGVHLPNLDTLRDRFEVVHVCDVDRSVAESVADTLPGQVVASDDWADVLADPRVEAVLVLTPGSHGDVARAALEAGRHVLSEKPLAFSAAEATALAELAESRGLVLQVGYMKMHDPAVPQARAALDDLGSLRVVRVTVLHPTDECQFEHHHLRRGTDARADLIARGNAYSEARALEAVGGPSRPASLYTDVLLGSVVHELSLLRALGLGLPTEFDFVSVDPPLSGPAAEPPRLLAVGTIPGGAQLQLSWNWVPDFPEYTEEVAVFGSAGRLYLSMPGPYLAAHRARLAVQTADGPIRTERVITAGHTTAFVVELAAFAASVREGAPVASDAWGAVEDTRCLQALVRAAAAREGLDVGGEAAGRPPQRTDPGAGGAT